MENKSFDKIKNEIDEENKNIDAMVKIEMDKIKEENKKQTIEYSDDEENNQNQHKIVINQRYSSILKVGGYIWHKKNYYI